jgi:hypothetical protein
MNALSDHQADTDRSSSCTSSAPCQYTLRRTGRRAVRFIGWQIVEVHGIEVPTSGRVADTMWYDLAIFRSIADAVIVELTARRMQPGEQANHYVEAFSSLQDAASWLESYDCANDVTVPQELAVGHDPIALSILQAVQLRQRIASIRDDYRGMLSDVFDALDITDSETAVLREPGQENAQIAS